MESKNSCWIDWKLGEVVGGRKGDNKDTLLPRIGVPAVSKVEGENSVTLVIKPPVATSACQVVKESSDGKLVFVGEYIIPSLTISYSDMVPGQEYHYRVRARTTEGVGKWSEAITVKRPLKPEAPAPMPQIALQKVPQAAKSPSRAAVRILAVLFVLLILALISKVIWWTLAGTSTHAVAVVLPSPPIAAVASAAPVAPTASIVFIKVINVDRNSTSDIDSTWLKERPQIECSLDDLNYQTTYTGDRIMEVHVDPGQDIEYLIPNPEVWCPVVHFTRYLGDRDHLDVAINGRSWRKNNDGQAPTETTRSYRFRNRSNQSANMTFRLVPRRH
jgi:hypothetical protein